MTTGSDKKKETSWAQEPDGTLLEVRRAFREGGKQQWAVLPDGDQVRLQKLDDGDWTDVGTYPDIPAVFAAQPELARQRPGRATYFDLSPDAGIGDKELAAMLDPCADEGNDSPGWAEAAGDWEDCEIWKWVKDLDFLRRLVCIDDCDVSWIDNGGFVPVFADWDGFIGREIASFGLGFTGYSMVGYTGGAQLILIAPGLAVSLPTGDDVDESGRFQPFLVAYPEEGTTTERAAALVRWLDEAEIETEGQPHLGLHAAFQFEPFDPNGTLDEDSDRGLSVNFSFEGGFAIPDDVTDDFRDLMDDPGSEYAYVKEALTDPRGRAARALAEADDFTFFDGCWYNALLEEDQME